MKEITRIHLAGTPYNIELAAKKKLEKYISGIESVLAADDEALREIEARMVELLTERHVKGEQVITVADVEALEQRLGAPGEFIDEPVTARVFDKKRLMRDEKNGMVGGVLAGVAAYSGVDVVWWRIATILLTFVSFGTGLLLYVVLWIAIPAARTAADRLQMRGERATLENIQAESSIDVNDKPVHKKPLVIVLRIAAALCLFGVLLGSLCLVAFALLAGVPLLSVNDWVSNGWLMTALLLGSVSGVLLAALMGIGVYMMAAWRAPKSLVWLSAGIVIVGLTTFGAGVGIGVYGGQQLERAIEKHTVTYRENMSELEGVTALRLEGVDSNIEYRTTTGSPYVEVKAFQRDTSTKIPVKVERSDKTARLIVGALPKEECGIWIGDCVHPYADVTVYGPALASLDVVNSNVRYVAVDTQSALKVTARDDSRVTLEGRFTEVDAVVQRSVVWAEDAAINDVALNVESSDIELGVVRLLAVTSHTSCAADAYTQIDYERAEKVTLNGVFSPGLGRESCVEFDRSDDDL